MNTIINSVNTTLNNSIGYRASGELILAQALYATIAAQSGWLTALQ